MLTLNVMQPEEIRMDQTPTTLRWKLIPLYKLSIMEGMIFWQIGFDGISNLEISTGFEDIENKIPLNINKINNQSIKEQALREARRQYKLKYYEGYQPAGNINIPGMKAMKGYEYKDDCIKTWPVYTQPKLDGVKMLCQDLGKAGTNTMMVNRIPGTFMSLGNVSNGNRILSMRSSLNNPFTHFTHIESELYDFFAYLPRHAILDGELYNHGMNFSTLTSAVKTIKTIHPRLHDVEFWICDINYEDPDGAPFEKRCALLINAFRKYIQDRSPISSPEDISVLPKSFRIVPTNIARTHVELLQQHDHHVASGYEGIMIKKITNGYPAGSKQYTEALYRPGKNNHILKYKKFIDEEATIVHITDGNIFTVKDIRGNIFDVKMRDPIIESENFSNPAIINRMMGNQLTIRYQERSQDSIPQAPIGICVRDYE